MKSSPGLVRGYFPVCTVNAKNINANLDLTSNVSSVKEYARYSKYGHIVVIDIGGIIINKAGFSMQIATGLPKGITRAVGFLGIDASNNGATATDMSLMYMIPSTGELYAHIITSLVGKSLYGQMVYFV